MRASGISKRYGATVALDRVSIDINAGEIHALMGENGAGKSTLMKILSGVVPPDDGDLLVDGAPVRFSSIAQAEACGIALIHQELNLVPDLSVAENIFLGREPAVAGLLVKRGEAAARARALLDSLGVDIDPGEKLGKLRVGEQQLVEIAKALGKSARILLLDEPTSALSPPECERLFEVTARLAREGMGLVYISHRMKEVMRLADRVTVLRDGRHIVTTPLEQTSEDEIIRAMVGREIKNASPPPRRVPGPVALSVSGLSVVAASRGGPRPVVQDVSFAVRKGEIFGIGGLMGAGRTETLDAIFGVARGSVTGQVEVNGTPFAARNPARAIRRGLAYLTEDRKGSGLVLHESIRDNALLAVLDRLAVNGFRSRQAERTKAQELVATLSIKCRDIHQPVSGLSGGNQQKTVLAKWMATNPGILLLDEPTRGIDVGAKAELYDLVFRMAEEGMAVILVSSEMPELMFLSDRIMVMAEGRQTGILKRGEASEEAIMRLATPGGVVQEKETV